MEKFTTFTSLVLALPRKDVDTDLIIPAQYLTSISRQGYGKNLFRRLLGEDKNFATAFAKYQGAQILVADRNFGCGSSREAAVWALQGAGFKVVIAPEFADIFASNAAKNGLVLIELEQHTVANFISAASQESFSLTINLEKQLVLEVNGAIHQFTYDAFRKHCVLNGLDDLDYILSHAQALDTYRVGVARKTSLL